MQFDPHSWTASRSMAVSVGFFRLRGDNHLAISLLSVLPLVWEHESRQHESFTAPASTGPSTPWRGHYVGLLGAADSSNNPDDSRQIPRALPSRDASCPKNGARTILQPRQPVTRPEPRFAIAVVAFTEKLFP